MNLLQNETFGEIRVVRLENGRPVEIVIHRDLALNYGDIVLAKITAYHPVLHGYFAMTDRGDIFIPTTESFTEGQTVKVQIIKERRTDKVATAHLQIDENLCFRATGENIDSTEMDDLIATAMDATVPFGDGGILHIEKTKVCWTIDVDTGTSRSPIAVVNELAVVEIAHQIRLKNMGGCILIDFAGSKRGKNRLRIKQLLSENLMSDTLTTVHGWTKIGLFEIERGRGRADLWTTCYPENPVVVYYRIRRALVQERSGHPVITAAPEVCRLLNKSAVRAKIVPSFDTPISFFTVRGE